MTTTLDIQLRLLELGYDPGPLDGIRGRQTIQAVERYQRANHLTVDGIVGPQTLRAMFGGALVKPEDSPDAMPWLDEARRLMGTREVSGKANSPVIMDWAAQLDIWYPSDDVAWCGLFVGHCVGSTMPREALPVNPLGARNWAGFGDACDLIDGAIASFWRGSKSGWLGHVGIVTGQTSRTVEIIGGNQSDMVSVIQMPRDRLLATRWPQTAPKVTRTTTGSTAGMTNGNEA
ncbi:MAG: hypothetical protein JWR80_8031 [Bradyrhizobium sp.]|nr:hypothetical protein [Bradyrhizobium sp.]